MARIECEVKAAQVTLDGRVLAGITVTCTDCGHCVAVAGESERSIKRGLATLRDECPEGQENFYVTDDGD